MRSPHDIYMHRCLQLAEQAAGYTAPNPMVGAVLVHNDRIIGEGLHEVYGGPHAEVSCINSVSAAGRSLLAESVMYVSLEPCAHYGKTPPCADLIVRNRIPHVIIGCRDPFKEVDGKGIEKLQAAGVRTEVGILENECRQLNKRFFTFHSLHRPYVILKWAQTGDRKIGNSGNNRLMITGSATNTLVHKWRSEEAAILVGTNTAAMDNPRLTNRLWRGPSPARIVVDMDLRLPPTLHLFDGATHTIVFNTKKHGQENGVLYYQVTADTNLVHQIIHALYQLKILSVMIEGGTMLLQSFIDDGSWDEARVLTNHSITLDGGISAPELKNAFFLKEEISDGDELRYYVRQ